MAIPEMKSGDLEIKIIEQDYNNFKITDKTGKVLKVKINNKIFDMKEPQNTGCEFNKPFNQNFVTFTVDKTFAQTIKDKSPTFIGISEKKDIWDYIFVKCIHNSYELKIINDDNQTTSTFNTQQGNLIVTTNRGEQEEKSKIYPSQGSFTYQKETPKPTTSDNNAEIGKLKVDKYRLEEELKKTKEALEKVTQSKYGQNELVNSLKEEIQKLEREKRDIEYEFSVLKRKFEEINKNNTDLGINIKAKDEQFISLRNTYSNLINEYDKLKAELNNKTNELNKKITELEKIKNEKEGLENTISDLKQVKDDEGRKIRAEYGNIKPNTKAEILMEFLYWYINNEGSKCLSRIFEKESEYIKNDNKDHILSNFPEYINDKGEIENIQNLEIDLKDFKDYVERVVIKKDTKTKLGLDPDDKTVESLYNIYSVINYFYTKVKTAKD